MARDVGGALSTLAVLFPLLLTRQLQCPHECPRRLEGECAALCYPLPFVPKPVRPGDPPCIAVHFVWAAWDVGGALATLAVLGPLLPARQL